MTFPIAVVVGLAIGLPAHALDHVRFQHKGKQIEVSGRLLAKAEDGGLFVESPEGVLWTIQPEVIAEHTSDKTPFEPLPPEKLAARLLAELPAGFEVHRTKHYLFLYGTSKEYAQWCGSLFERLYSAFTNYWGQRGFEMLEPDRPLVAVLFPDRASFEEHAVAELGEVGRSMIGYYHIGTNRVTLYDLTGAAHAGQPRRGFNVDRVLAQPGAERTVATFIHEATHQIAFNLGLHTRMSDCPRWFSEGIAMYFETPNFASAKGWRNIGGVNQVQLANFQDYLPRRPADSLRTLIADDNRFAAKGINDTTGESWALAYFLMKQRPKELAAYLRVIGAKKPLVWDDAKTRTAEFEAAFGDLQKLDAEFVRFLSTRVR